MKLTAAPLWGVLVLKPKRVRDERGFFCESYNRGLLAEAGIKVNSVQDNLSLSRMPLTLRGLHFQREPFSQAKLTYVLKGAVLIVDLRRGSSSFGKHFSVELSASEGDQLFIPIGFAHGFITLEPDTLAYKVSDYYSADHDAGIRFDDAILAIDWGAPPDLVTLSDRDRELPFFDPNAEYFA